MRGGYTYADPEALTIDDLYQLRSAALLAMSVDAYRSQLSDDAIVACYEYCRTIPSPRETSSDPALMELLRHADEITSVVQGQTVASEIFQLRLLDRIEEARARASQGPGK